MVSGEFVGTYNRIFIIVTYNLNKGRLNQANKQNVSVLVYSVVLKCYRKLLYVLTLFSPPYHSIFTR